MSQSKGLYTIKLPWEAYNTYFKVNKVLENGNYIVSCQLCFVGKPLSVSKSSPSNKKVHMTRKHPSNLNGLLAKIEESKRRTNRKITNNNDDVVSPEPKSQSQQSTIGQCFSGNVRTATKEDIDQELVNWVIDSLQPFSEVERPSFITLWTKLTNRKLITRKTLTNRIEVMGKEYESQIVQKLQSVDYVCTAADCWTGGRRAFLGVTCHYIDPETYERKSVALACKRIKGRHTHDVLAKELQEIFLKFQIHNKNIMTVTDNGSNFVKAFSVFGGTDADDNMDFDLEDDGEGDEFLQLFVDEEPIDQVNSYTGIIHSLPNHRRCAAHTLNLIAVKDSEKAFTDIKYKKINRGTFAKLQSLWNKSRQSSLASDLVVEKLNRHLIVPNATRWNSVFDSVDLFSSLLKTMEGNVHSLCDGLGLPRFTQAEIDFIQEYVDVMKPISKALDILQGETNISLGYLLPTLTKLNDHLDKLLAKPLKICTALVIALKEAIERRFTDDFANDELILAACFHPRFKLHWLKEETKIEEAKRKMKDKLRSESPAESSSSACSNSNTTTTADEYDGFFDYEEKTTKNQMSVEDELESFIREGLGPFSTIGNYKIIKEVCLKLNTGIPSSASVERLFSFAKEVFGVKRQRLTDINFERQLLLKFNLCKK